MKTQFGNIVLPNINYIAVGLPPIPSHQVSVFEANELGFYKENFLYLFAWEQFQRELPGQGALPQISSWDVAPGCWAGICWLLSISSENQVWSSPLNSPPTPQVLM